MAYRNFRSRVSPVKLPDFSRVPEVRNPPEWPRAHGERFVVIGGCGFLGAALVQQLLDSDTRRFVVVVDIARPSAALQASWPTERVRFVEGDAVSGRGVREALEGADAVLHVASVMPYNQRMAFQWPRVRAVNVDAVERTLMLAREAGARAFVYTSSTNAAIGADPLVCGVTEATAPAGDAPPSHYARSKRLAERAVLADSDAGMRTCAIRPPGLYGRSLGSGDHFIVERDFAERRVKSTTDVQARAVQDFIAVDNVAFAHVLAVEALLEDRPGAAGEAFFVSDDQPLSFEAFENMRAEALGVPRVAPQAPHLLLEWMAIVSEALQWLTRGRLPPPPLNMLTPPAMFIMHATYYVDISKAKEILNYRPLLSTSEALKKYALDFAATPAVDTASKKIE